MVGQKQGGGWRDRKPDSRDYSWFFGKHACIRHANNKRGTSVMMEPVCCGTDGMWLISELMHCDVVFQCEASVCDACLVHFAGPLGHAAGRTGADGTVHGCDRWHRSQGHLGLLRLNGPYSITGLHLEGILATGFSMEGSAKRGRAGDSMDATLVANWGFYPDAG